MIAAELLVECLKQEGVEMITGYSGRPLLSLMQAVHAAGIRHFQSRHEQGAGFMADGYSRVSNRPGIVMVQRGPGVTNCLTAIANAYIDGIPLIVLIGQGEMEMFDKGALQELDHLAFLPYFTKRTFRLYSPDRIVELIRRAFSLSVSGKPGPVAIELPMNLMESTLSGQIAHYTPQKGRLRFEADPQTVSKAVSCLVEAANPVIYAGAGVLRAKATAELKKLAELLALPVMTSLPGKSGFPEDHELSLGIGGFPRATYGTKQAHEFVAKADCVLALGASFKEHGTRYFKEMPRNVRLIQVDICQEELSKNYPADHAMLGDLKSVLGQLIHKSQELIEQPRLCEKVTGRRKQVAVEIKRIKAQWEQEWSPHMQSDAKPINPYRITKELMGIPALDNGIVLHDAGLCRAYICHHYQAVRPGSFIGFGGFSAMGFSIPASLGAKIAAPDKNIFTVVGDGSFGMTGFEIETAVRYGIKTVTLIYNNRGLDAVKTLQQRRGEPYVWEYVGGDYAAIAKAMGAFATRVTRPEDITPAILAAVEQEKPAVLDIHIADLIPTPNYP